MKKADSVAKNVRNKIARGGSRVWRVSDFKPLRAAAVARELSRMEKSGLLRRIRKGVYAPAGKSVEETVSRPLHPARHSAAHALHLAPKPRKPHYATPLSSMQLPGAHIISRRPRSRWNISPEDGALLEFIRDRGAYSDRSPDEIRRTILGLLRAGAWERIYRPALDEPPRTRAILGALGEEADVLPSNLYVLRRSLNELSRFDFGKFSSLRYAERWQAKI